MPLAGGFITAEQISLEELFPLKVHYCTNCTLVQVLSVVEPSTLFEDYKYISSVIPALAKHFKEYSEYLVEHYLSEKSKLLEFGCNDGALLQNFKDTKINAYGIDPSVNVSQFARDKGLNVRTGYFDQVQAKLLEKEIGLVDVVTGSNVFAHVDDIQEILKSANIILKPDGVFIVEVHYLLDLIKQNQYDTIYHEHLCYYSVTALKNIFARAGMKIIDVVHLPMHGGSIRVVAAKQNSVRRINASVAEFLIDERTITKEGLDSFAAFCLKHRSELTTLLRKLKTEGNTVVGYGAPGRGTILLNYCGREQDSLAYIVDISPLRVGKLMPGVHIPILSLEVARKNPPDYFLLLAWNYCESILEQEHVLRANGTKFIIPFPNIQVK